MYVQRVCVCLKYALAISFLGYLWCGLFFSHVNHCNGGLAYNDKFIQYSMLYLFVDIAVFIENIQLSYQYSGSDGLKILCDERVSKSILTIN